MPDEKVQLIWGAVVYFTEHIWGIQNTENLKLYCKGHCSKNDCGWEKSIHTYHSSLLLPSSSSTTTTWISLVPSIITTIITIHTLIIFCSSDLTTCLLAQVRLREGEAQLYQDNDLTFNIDSLDTKIKFNTVNWKTNRTHDWVKGLEKARHITCSIP